MEWTNELLEAAHLGKVGEIKRLLCTGSDPNSRGFIQAPVRGACSVSRSALHVAAIQSHYECIIELIRRGAHINVQDEDGYTPSHYLCQKYVNSDEEGERISKCLKVLFKFGASARIRTFTGQLSLHDLALRSKNWFCAKIVEEEASKVNSLKKLCRFAIVNYLQIHCKKGVQLIDQLPLPSSMKRYLEFCDVTTND